MSQHTENVARQTLGLARQPRHVVPHEDAAALRVREASARSRMGGQLHRRPHQRHLHAAHIVLAVPPMSALLLAKYGLVQGEVAGRAGERGAPSVASAPDHVNQLAMLGGVVDAWPSLRTAASASTLACPAAGADAIRLLVYEMNQSHIILISNISLTLSPFSFDLRIYTGQQID